ncbi:hypothetical protein [Devosia indica]
MARPKARTIERRLTPHLEQVNAPKGHCRDDLLEILRYRRRLAAMDSPKSTRRKLE